MTQRSRTIREGYIQPASPSRSSHRAGRPLPSVRSASTKPVARRVYRGDAQPWRTKGAATRRRPRIGTYICAVLVAVLAVAALRSFHRLASAGPLKAALAGSPGDSTASPPKPQVDQQFVAQYQNAVQSYVGGRPGMYAIASYDLATGAGVAVNANAQFRAASVNKLELLVDLYQKAAAKQLDLDSSTTLTADDIQNYGTGPLQAQGPGKSYTYRQLAQFAAEESDNTAAYVIGKRLGLQNVQADLVKWGLTQTSMADNLTTASDVALLLTRLQKRELLPDAQTAEILNMLEHTVWTDRIQSGVPQGVTVAHKIGTDVGVYNDAAVILNGDRPYVEVILSSGTDEAGALESMTHVSQTIFQFESGIPAATATPRSGR